MKGDYVKEIRKSKSQMKYTCYIVGEKSKNLVLSVWEFVFIPGI